jgi:hypothetical protein
LDVLDPGSVGRIRAAAAERALAARIRPADVFGASLRPGNGGFASRRFIVGLRALRTIGAAIGGAVIVGRRERWRRRTGQEHQDKELTHGHYLGTVDLYGDPCAFADERRVNRSASES